MGCAVDDAPILTATSDFPELCVEWLPTHGPFVADGEWCDISMYVASGTVKRGRQYELDRFQAGSCTLTLRSDTRLFDGENTASPFYPWLVPMRQIQISAVWNSVRYPVFRGYITDWGQTVPADSLFETTIEAKDAFVLLEMIELPSSAWALEVLRDDPDLWFRLGETDTVRVTDSSSGGNYGLYDNATQGAAGLVVNDADGAAQFTNASQDRVVIQNKSLITDFPFTFSCLFQIDEDGGAQAGTYILSGRRAGTNAGLRIHATSSAPGRISFRNADSTFTNVRWVRTQRVWFDNKPHHLMCVAESSSSFLIYVDGELQTTDDLSTGTGTPAFVAPDDYYSVGNASWESGYIAGVGSGWGGTEDGTLDEVCVWDGKALSAARAAAHSLAAKFGWEGDDTGARADRFLDAIGWPDTLRDIDTGISILGAANWSVGTSAHAVLQAWADTEFGAYFIGKDGKIIWRSRHFPLLDSTATTSQATFGDGHSAATLKYLDTGTDPFTRDTALIRNPVQAGRTGGVTVKLEDATYREKYGHRTWTAPNSEDKYDAAIHDRARWLVDRYKELGSRLREIKIAPRSDTDLWAQALGREIGERITVKRTPLGLNSETSLPQIIESISHSFSPTFWETSFTGSPVDPNVGDYLILDDSDYGLLDTGELAY